MGRRRALNGWYLRSLKDKDGVYRTYKVFYKHGIILHKRLVKQAKAPNYLKDLSDRELDSYIEDETQGYHEYDKNALNGMAQDEKNHLLTLQSEKERRLKEQLDYIEERKYSLIGEKTLVEDSNKSDTEKRAKISDLEDEIDYAKSAYIKNQKELAATKENMQELMK